MAVRGITKVRDEAHIIGSTLDTWAQLCDTVHVYCDVCEDETAEICREHPIVCEVIESDLFDPDRERAEWFNRQHLLRSAQRFLTDDDWVVYFDADEHLEMIDLDLLRDPAVECIVVELYDAYITDADADLSREQFAEREWVGDEFMYLPVAYRNRLHLEFFRPDQRVMTVQPCSLALGGRIRHWGKAISVDHFERKCTYYGEVFGPKYADKWLARRGNAVHSQSDFGRPLVRWQDIASGAVDGVNRQGMELVQ